MGQQGPIEVPELDEALVNHFEQVMPQAVLLNGPARIPDHPGFELERWMLSPGSKPVAKLVAYS